jgi:hypothetical protein
MSTFGDILPVQAAGLLSSFTATRSDSWFPTEPWKCCFVFSCTFCFSGKNRWQFHDCGWDMMQEFKLSLTQVQRLCMSCIDTKWKFSEVKWVRSETVVKVDLWRKGEASGSLNRSSGDQKKVLCLPVHTVERNQ